MEPSSITDSKQACFAGIAAFIFQEEGDGLLPLVTRCENSLFEENFLSAYAKRLGLDPTDVIMLHQKYAEKLSFSKSRVSKHPSASRRKRVNVRLFVISISVALLIAVIVYASFKLLH